MYVAMFSERVSRYFLAVACGMFLMFTLQQSPGLLSRLETGLLRPGLSANGGRSPATVDHTEKKEDEFQTRRSSEMERGTETMKLTGEHAWKWVDVFSFVPYALENCKKLFEGTGHYTPEFRTMYDVFLARIKSVKVSEGTSADYEEEFLAFISLAQAPFVRTICETGFNAGHSTFAWLAANPHARVYSFDMGTHDYAKTMAQYLMGQFPGRLNVTWGDSTITLPKFHREHPELKCDLMIIDGGHTYDACKSDLDNFRKMASRDNILILDNFPQTRFNFLGKLGRVWEEAKRNAEIAEVFRCHFDEGRQGFSVGHIIVP